MELGWDAGIYTNSLESCAVKMNSAIHSGFQTTLCQSGGKPFEYMQCLFLTTRRKMKNSHGTDIFGLFNCDQWLWCRTIFDLYWWNSLFEMRCRVYASLHVNPSWREFFLFAKQINITGLIFGGMFKVTGWVNLIVLPKAILWCTERCLFRFVRMCEVFTLVSVLNDVCQTISTFSQRCRHGDRLTTACLLADTKILACKMLQILKRNVCL